VNTFYLLQIIIKRPTGLKKKKAPVPIALEIF